MRFLLPFLILTLAGALCAEEAAAGGLPAEATGFAGTLVGTKVGFTKAVLTLKVEEATPGAKNKATDASKLKGLEVPLAVAYDVKTPEGKWGVNKEVVEAVKAIAKGAKVTIEVKSDKKGGLLIAGLPKGEGDAAAKPAEAKPEEAKPEAPKSE